MQDKNIKELTQRSEEITMEITGKQIMLDDLEASLGDAQKIIDSAEIVSQQNSELSVQVDKKRDELRRAKESVSSVSISLAALTKKRAALDDQVNKLKTTQQELDNCVALEQVKLRDLRESSNELESKIEHQRVEHDNLTTALAKKESMQQDLETLRKEQFDLRNQVDILKNEVELERHTLRTVILSRTDSGRSDASDFSSLGNGYQRTPFLSINVRVPAPVLFHGLNVLLWIF